jgi:hypothetical protein
LAEYKPAAWQAFSSEEVLTRSWEGETVAHCLSTGGTHLLGASASLILESLRNRYPAACLEVDLLAEFLADDDGQTGQAEDAVLLHEALVRLEELALIRRHT